MKPRRRMPQPGTAWPESPYFRTIRTRLLICFRRLLCLLPTLPPERGVMFTLLALPDQQARWKKPGSFTGRRSQPKAHPAWPERPRKKNRKQYHNRIRRFEMKFIAIVTVGLVAGSLAMAQMKVKSRGEGTAVNAMLGAQDPDARI